MNQLKNEGQIIHTTELGEHPMKCLLKSLLGQDSYEEENYNHKNNNVCTPLPPIVKSIVGSVLFIILMAMISNMMRF